MTHVHSVHLLVKYCLDVGFEGGIDCFKPPFPLLLRGDLLKKMSAGGRLANMAVESLSSI